MRGGMERRANIWVSAFTGALAINKRALRMVESVAVFGQLTRSVAARLTLIFTSELFRWF